MDDFNASDTRSIKRLAKAARLAERGREEVVFSLMSTPQGRDWVWDLLNRCHIFTTTFSSDPYSSAFNEGSRNVGLQLLADVLRAAPDQYIQMTREANDRRISADRGSLGNSEDDRRPDPGRSTDLPDLPDDPYDYGVREYPPNGDEAE